MEKLNTWAVVTLRKSKKCFRHYLRLRQLVESPARFARQEVPLLALSLLVYLGRAQPVSEQEILVVIRLYL